MAMASKTNVHGPASYMQNTGFLLPGFPCMGAWISYGLGSLTDNLPTFVVLPDPRGLPYNNAGNFSAGFLPAAHQGTVIKPHGRRSPIADLRPPSRRKFITPDSEADGLALLRAAEPPTTLAERPGDSRLEARIASLRAGRQDAAQRPGGARPVARDGGDAQGCTASTTKPTADFGRNCLIARRLLERGVRFVQVWSGTGGAEQQLGQPHRHPQRAAAHRPAASTSRSPPCCNDLKARGMLDDTLVVWTTEFGRMPFTQGADRPRPQRRHVRHLAGRRRHQAAASAHGESDEFAYQAAEDTTYVLRPARDDPAPAGHRPRAADRSATTASTAG